MCDASGETRDEGKATAIMAHQTHETTTTEKTLDELLTARRAERAEERERQYEEDKASYQAKMEQQHDTFTDALNADFSDALVASLHMEMVYEPPTTTDDDITSGRWVGRFIMPDGVWFQLEYGHRYSQLQWTLTSGKYSHMIGWRQDWQPQLDTQLLDGLIEYQAWRESYVAIEAAIANKPKLAPEPAPAPKMFATVGDFLRGGTTNRVLVFLTTRNEHDDTDAMTGTIFETNTHWVLLTLDDDAGQRLIPIHQISQIIPLPPKQPADK